MNSHRLTGRFVLELPPDKAFPLFTARGEILWAPGWEPLFPVPTEDDSAPGTVFATVAHGARTVWVVVDSVPPQRIRYAQVRQDERAGTVEVTLAPVEGGSEVTVTYHLTPLTAAGGVGLDHFAAEYPAFLAEWPAAIATQMDAHS